jgi:hypothetical protein
MASAFPGIAPTARSWSPGVMPQSTFTTLSGHEVRTSHTSKLIGASLSLSFNNIQEATLKLILDHYNAARSTFETFTLSAQVCAGMTNDYLTPAGQQWKYDGAPSVEFVAPGVASVSVSLTAVPQ